LRERGSELNGHLDGLKEGIMRSKEFFIAPMGTKELLEEI